LTTALLMHFGLAVALASAALVITRLFRRPEIGHLLWVLVFIKLIIPPFIDVPLLPARETIPPVLDAAVPITHAVPESLPLMTPDFSPALVHAKQPSTTWAWFTLPRMVAVIWLIGCLLYAGRTFRLTMRFRRLIRQSAAADRSLRQLVDGLANDVGSRRTPTVRVIDHTISPAIWPSSPAMLLLPRGLLDQLSPDELRTVLLHELSHYARRDHWVRSLELIVLSVYWWLPVVWWFRHELRTAEEACCDNRVLRSASEHPATYAEALIKTAAFLGRPPMRPLPHVATGASTTRTLARRITMIMAPTTASSPRRIWYTLVCTLALLAFPLLPAHSRDSATDPELAIKSLDMTVDIQPGPTSSEVQMQADAPNVQSPLGDDVTRNPDLMYACEPTVSGMEQTIVTQALELLEHDDSDGALRLLASLDTAERSAMIDFTIANIHFQQERLPEARHAFEMAVNKAPAFHRAWFNLGTVYMRQNKHDQAAAALQQAINTGEPTATMYGLLGYSSSQAGDLKTAESAYWIAHTLDPVTHDWVLGLVQTMFQQDRYADSIVMLDRILKTQPDNTDLMALKVNAYLGLNQPARAAAIIERIDQRGKSSPDLLNTLASIRVNQQHYAQAVELSRRVLAMDGAGSVESWLVIARVLLASDRLEEARTVVSNIETVAEDKLKPALLVEVLRLRARLALAEGDSTAEAALLEQIIALNPADGEAMLLLGMHYQRAGDESHAAFWFGRAATIEVFEADAITRYAQLLVKQQEYRRAARMLQRAQEIKPRDSVQQFLDQILRLVPDDEQPPVLDMRYHASCSWH
jgi:beta-lactamase regulating signal transducer with metallopeptidase domain/tetratricopeptide (TPR) repeat protein